MKTVEVQVQCVACKSPVTVTFQAVPAIMNVEGSSVAVWDHPKRTRCLGCGADVVPAIAQIDSVRLVAAPTRDQPDRIVRPSSLHVV